MGAPGRALQAAIAGALAVALAAGGTAAVEEPGPSTLRVSNEDIQFRSDVEGCDVPGAWQLCVYFQHSLGSVARVVPDGPRTAHREG